MGKISEGDYIGTPALVPFEYAAKACLEAQEYQEAQYYKKALQKYGYALENYEIFFRFCDESDKNIVSFETEIKLLFLLLNFVDQVKKCYAELNEPYKSLVFQKKFEEIVKTIGKHEKALNSKQFIAYKNITKALESIYEEIPLAEFSTTTLEDTSQVADNSDDPLFRELVENYDKCCSYKTLLVPSKGVSFSSSSSDSSISHDDRQRPGNNKFIPIVAAIFFPPLAVYLTVGLGTQFWINLLLTFVFPWIPGMIHAVWLVYNHD